MPQTTFYFYDLETSGVNPRSARIMQFAGQRTDANLNPIGEADNILIKMSDDVLPEPDAILLTGITPQATIFDGITEADFLRYFYEDIAQPGTIFVGFNSIRFDDEFMRYINYRNFYDAYEWQWKENRSRWDMLDVVRMTRALRPDGIKWPFDSSGKPSNRLELLSSINGLDHEHAHDALSDVFATIAVARLIHNKQPKLFNYLLDNRSKQAVAQLVDADRPFVYTSGAYESEFEKTTVAQKICDHPGRQGSLVFDLRYDPTIYAEMTAEELAEKWKWRKGSDEKRLPVKSLQYNKCPAVAPLGVMFANKKSKVLGLELGAIERNSRALSQMLDFPARMIKAWEILESGREQTSMLSIDQDVDSALYNGFFNDQDKNAMAVVRAAEPSEISELNLPFNDSRLEALLPLYKARNFPKLLSTEERIEWEKYRSQKLLGGGESSQIAKFYARLQEIASRANMTQDQSYLIEELKLYAEGIMPEVD